MSFWFRNWWGGKEHNVLLEDLPRLLQTLEEADDEHPQVDLGNSEGLVVSVHKNGLVIITDDQDYEYFKRGLDRAETLALMGRVATLDFDVASLRGWDDG